MKGASGDGGPDVGAPRPGEEQRAPPAFRYAPIPAHSSEAGDRAALVVYPDTHTFPSPRGNQVKFHGRPLFQEPLVRVSSAPSPAPSLNLTPVQAHSYSRGGAWHYWPRRAGAGRSPCCSGGLRPRTAACALRGAVARVRGGAMYRDDDDYSDDVMVHGGDGPVAHDCGAHAGPPCRASDRLLWAAAFAGDVDSVRQALLDGADPNAPNPCDSDRAALHYVVSTRNTSCPRCAWSVPDGDPACPCRQQLIWELVRAGADATRPCALGARCVCVRVCVVCVCVCVRCASRLDHHACVRLRARTHTHTHTHTHTPGRCTWQPPPGRSRQSRL